MAKKSYNYSVFLNCPIDKTYTRLFRIMVFTVIRCGCYVRFALEESDGSELRLHKIFRMIEESRLGIHDLSRTQLDKKTRLPRFNMPLELGVFLAAKYFGRGEQDRKSCLIFEQSPHTYEKFISDIKGQDIEAHENKPKVMASKIRDWLALNIKQKYLPGGQTIYKDYLSFTIWLPKKCHKVDLDIRVLSFGDYVNLVYEWLDSKKFIQDNAIRRK